MRRRGAPRSAQYGQACVRCATAKCRCISLPDGNGCERCYRLGKPCRPPEPASQRAANNNSESDDRIAQLEGRLDTIVSLLKTRGDGNGNRAFVTEEQSRVSRHFPITPDSPSLDSATNTFHEPSDADVDADVEVGSEDGANHGHVGQNISSGSVGGAAPGAMPHDHPVVAAVSQPMEDISAACFDTFRSRMLLHFPIIYLPPTLTVEQLRRDRPLLFQAIVCVAWPFAREREARGIELKRTLCEAAFLRQTHGNMNQPGGIDSVVDLLLGLMTYIAWGWDHVHHRGNLSRLVMLCMSLVGGLYLDRPALDAHHTASLLVSGPSGTASSSTQLSAETHRAVLGCFVLSSVVSEYFSNMDPMAWTPQMEGILVAISRGRECPMDTDLVYQVRLQLLSNQAVNLRQVLQQQESNHETPPKLSAATVFSDAETLQGQLQELRRHPSWSSRHHQLQLAHSHYVELLILETIRISSLLLSRLAAPETISSGSSHAPDSSAHSIEQSTPRGYSDLSYMWQSVLAIGACTSGLLSLQPSDFVGIAFVQWEQLAGCVVVLSQLESLEDSRINRAHARSVIDLPILLDRIAEKLSLTAAEAGEQGLGPPGGVFTQLAAGMRAFRSSIQGSMVELARPGPDEVSGCGGSNAVQPLQGHLNTEGPASRFWMDRLFQE